MPVEVRPLGVACNLKCTYCYQNPVRDALNVKTLYNMDAIIEQIDAANQEFHLFGGEALLVPKDDLERLWAYGLEKFGKNGMQTNATLIDEEHLALFKKYKVGVGISIDGPGELNDMRWAGTLDKTRAATQKIMDNIRWLAREEVSIGIIITLHKLNGTKENLPRLKNFIRWLGDNGVKHGNLHYLEVDSEIVRNQFCLTEQENQAAFVELAEFFEQNPDLQWNPFLDAKQMLKAEDEKATCFWRRCDPMNTQAVYGIEGDGALSNCGRTNKEGIDFYKASENGYERYIGFYHTSDEMGGCKGCRFWSLCGGSCPGEAENGDFRNKTIHCGTMKTLLTHYEGKLEAEGILPISKHPLLKVVEGRLLESLTRGENTTIHHLLQQVEAEAKQPIEIPVYDQKGEIVV